MALLEKHRSVLYAHFVEKVGEEAAQAMLDQFPVRDVDEAAALVRDAAAGTREFLWLHFNLSNQASRRWLSQHLDAPESFVSALDQAPSTRVDVAPGSSVAAISDLTVFAPDASEASAMLCS